MSDICERVDETVSQSLDMAEDLKSASNRERLRSLAEELEQIAGYLENHD